MDDGHARWRSRRGIALALRGVVLFAPVAVCVALSFAVTRLIPAPHAMAARIGWLAAVVAVCSLVAWPARRQLRRLLPLAALLELSILFPGEAPTRWRVAREAGSLRHLELLASGVPDTEPVRAATTILALVASLARHDRVTRGHSDRVRVFTDMIAAEMELPAADRDRLRWAALIHDIGKLEVPAKLLRKPGKPTADEWESLRLHPEVGARLAAPLAGWLGGHAGVVLQHHEHFDGSGYPAGLRGEQISLGARIVGLADAFEVMTAARPYKRAFSRSTALREVVRCSGSQFDPDVVRAFLAVSTPRLRRALGPASWIGQLPVVGTAPAGGFPAVATTVARGAGTVVLGGVASAVVVGTTGGVGVADVSASSHASQHDAAAGHGGGWVGTAPQVVVTGPNTAVASSPTPPTSPQVAPQSLIPTPRPPGDGAAPGPTPSQVLVAAPPTAAPGGQPPASAPSAAPPSGASGLAGTLQQVTSGVGGTVGGVVNGVGGTVGGVVNGVGGTVDGLLGGGSTAPPTTSPSTSPSPAPTTSGSGGSGGLGGLLGKLLGG
ncbi:MAG TPA: HD domain-containing phosphohydrolase [Acidothermaceae bacterium]|nr:HD domain-containing phosphohydrolase [Acidothermaceae bacterium]